MKKSFSRFFFFFYTKTVQKLLVKFSLVMVPYLVSTQMQPNNVTDVCFDHMYTTCTDNIMDGPCLAVRTDLSPQSNLNGTYLSTAHIFTLGRFDQFDWFKISMCLVIARNSVQNSCEAFNLGLQLCYKILKSSCSLIIYHRRTTVEGHAKWTLVFLVCRVLTHFLNLYAIFCTI